MAFQQHHDPRYAQSPYHFQAPFNAPPQQNTAAYGFGQPVAQTPLAPPQAYLSNRAQHQYPPHPPVASQAGFPGAFANTGQYQHNAQFNPNMVAGPAPMPYQTPQAMNGQFYNTRPFQNGPPPPPGQIPAMSASSPTNLVPPPPPPPALQQQQPSQTHGGSGQWPAGTNLPPKPPSVGYREPVELHSRQSSTHVQQQGLPGLGTSQAPAGFGERQARQGGLQSGAQQNNSSKQAQQAQGGESQAVNFHGHPPDNAYNPAQPFNMRQDEYSPASPTIVDLSQTEKNTPAHRNRVEESPDMYSPQLHPQHLPGLGGMPEEPDPKHHDPNSNGAGTNDGHYSPPAAVPPSMTMKAPNKFTPKQAVTSIPVIDPFAIKEQASKALRKLYANDIGFLDIAGNGIHPNVLRNLCIELGLELDSTKPKPKPKPKEKEDTKPKASAKESATSQQATPAKQPPAPPKKPVVQAPSKPLSREEYLAKLKAAKGEKEKALNPVTPDEPSSAPKSSEPAEVVMIPSDPATPATPGNGTSSPKPQTKKPDLKSKEQNALIRQRLEALKRSTLEKQQKQAQEAAQAAANAPKPLLKMTRANAAAETKANGEYTPANPFFASTGSFSGLPGLSMFDEPAQGLPGFGHADTYDINEDSHVAEPGEIEEDEDLEAPSRPTSGTGSRKRSFEAYAHDDAGPTKRRIDPHAQSQVVIELSDDEDEEGEVHDTNIPSAVQRQTSTSSAAKDQPSRDEVQSRIDALAAREETIRLYKQKIQAYEARKAKKAVSSDATPTPSATPAQTQSLAQVPEASSSSIPSTVLAAAGQQVQAQHDSFVAAKSMLVERLEKEEAKATAGESTPRKNQREQRIEMLRASVSKLDVEIAQAEAQKQRIQEEIERGIQGREEFSKELQALLAEMESEDTTSNIPNAELPEVEQTLVPSQNEQDFLDHDEDQDGDDAGDADDTMDISEDEDGEIDEDEVPNEDAARQYDGDNDQPEEDDDGLEDDFEPFDVEPAEVGSPQVDIQDGVDLQVADEGGDPPQLEEPTPASDDEVMDYEPDYEPEPAPGAESESEAEPEMDMDQSSAEDSEPGDYEPKDDLFDEPDGANEGSPREHASSAGSDNEVTGDQPGEQAETQRQVVSISDSPDTSASSVDNDKTHEEGEMLEEGLEESHYNPEHAQITAHRNPDEEMAAEDQVPGEDHDDSDDPEEVVMDESSDSEAANNEGTKTTGFTAYESPLQMFRSYKFSPQYVKQVPGGYQSLTFNHRIDAMEPLCRWELQGGTCVDSTCHSQHFRDLKLSDDKLILELGSLNEGNSDEERNNFTTGLKTLLVELRDQGVANDTDRVARELVAFRTRFWGDPSRFLTRIGTGL